jgi:NADPH-dependent curcumin reductase CurA
MPATAYQIVLAARPRGKVQPSDFRLEETPVPAPGPGEALMRVLYLSLDPYMRGRMDDAKSYAAPVALGDVMTAEGVAEIVESHHPDYAPGDIVLARTGWRSHAVSNGAGLRKLDPALAPITTALGVLGMPGFTAWSGLFTIGRPVAGETLVVGAASGPVGSLVGQLARDAGLRAVGVAGGPEKCAYVIEELGFNACVDHRDPEMPSLLAEACPHGVDIYFENVGGAVWQAVLPLLNTFARVPVCGLIANYNGAPAAAENLLPATMRAILTRSLTLRGFINYEFADQYPEFLAKIGPLVADGTIRYREDIVDGLENAPLAFMGMLEGRNFGKLIVRVADQAP